MIEEIEIPLELNPKNEEYKEGEPMYVIRNYAYILRDTPLEDFWESSPFRIYRFGENGIEDPQKGDGIKISDHEAIIISTLPKHSTGTPNPLHIRCSKNISIEDAILSVLQLTDLHYSSQQQPRCPVTTHNAHQISNLLRMNVRPPDDEGLLPWWL